MSEIPSRNDLARQCADLRDELDTLRKRFAEYQEQTVRDRAALELDAGKSVYDSRVGPRTDRRRRRWCYDCQTFTLTHAYPTGLLEGEIDVCDSCAAEANSGEERPS